MGDSWDVRDIDGILCEIIDTLQLYLDKLD